MMMYPASQRHASSIIPHESTTGFKYSASNFFLFPLQQWIANTEQKIKSKDFALLTPLQGILHCHPFHEFQIIMTADNREGKNTRDN